MADQDGISGAFFGVLQRPEGGIDHATFGRIETTVGLGEVPPVQSHKSDETSSCSQHGASARNTSEHEKSLPLNRDRVVGAKAPGPDSTTHHCGRTTRWARRTLGYAEHGSDVISESEI